MRCIWIEIFSPDFHEIFVRGGIYFNNFKFGPFIGRFPSDGAASIAVKGLNGFDRYSPSDNMTSQPNEINGPSFVGLAAWTLSLRQVLGQITLKYSDPFHVYFN